MANFFFKGKGFNLEMAYVPVKNKKGELVPSNIRVVRVIDAPDCYKHLGPKEIQPIVEYYYSEEIEEDALAAISI